jgi:hypothetical protein
MTFNHLLYAGSDPFDFHNYEKDYDEDRTGLGLQSHDPIGELKHADVNSFKKV